MRKMEMKTRNYTAPTVKVVTFMVEHGFAGSPDSVSMDDGMDGTGDIQEMNVQTYNDWGIG